MTTPPSLWARVAAVTPFGAGLVWLGLRGFEVWPVELSLISLEAGPVLLGGLAALFVGVGLAWRRSEGERERRRWVDVLSLLPAALAPLAVMAPWALVATHLGPGMAGLPTFLAWLTRYPNLGPVNDEILLGIGAVLGASAVPGLLAALVLHGWSPGRRGALIFVGLQLVTWIPVVVRLDLDTVVFAHFMYGGDALSFVAIAGGAVLRLLATISVAGYAALVWSRAESPLVWEGSEVDQHGQSQL